MRTATRSKSTAATLPAPRAFAAIARIPAPVPRSRPVKLAGTSSVMSASSRKQVAVVACSPVPKAIPAGIKIPATLEWLCFHCRHCCRSEKTFSFPRIDNGARGCAGSPVQICSETLVTRPPNRLTSSLAWRCWQYASILRALELGQVTKTTLEGPRNRRRSAHASSHFFELRRVQRCKRTRASGFSARAEFVGESGSFTSMRHASPCFTECLRKSHPQTEKM